MVSDQLILDRYEPLDTAGSGGFGTVYIAWDPRIQRKVAIKIIELSESDAYRAGLPGANAVQTPSFSGAQLERWHGVQPWDEYLEESRKAKLTSLESAHLPGETLPGSASSRKANKERRARFVASEPVTTLAHLPGLDEARTAAKLTDSRIVGVYDFEVRGQVAYLIMEYVEGITLTQFIENYEDYLTLDVIAAVFKAVSGALSVAHKAGVFHLDIKPDNILINAYGQVKVTDFGLATLADASGMGIAGGGTIGYMPLEQMRREPLDARTDEWSLASVIYEMLTGYNPFRAHSLTDAEKAIDGAEIILPSRCWDDVSEQIDDVMFCALDPNRNRRYASIDDFASELETYLGDESVGTDLLAAAVEDALGLTNTVDTDDELNPVNDSQKRGIFHRFVNQVGSAVRKKVFENGGEFIGRAIIVGLIAYLSFFAGSFLYSTVPAFGQNSVSIVGMVSAAIGAVFSVLWPPVGILIVYVLVGLSLTVARYTFVGVGIALSALIWWFICTRFSSQTRARHIILRVIAALLIATLVALLAFFPVSADFLPAAVVAIVALAVHALML